MEAREKARTRKEETRLKVLIGASMLADARVNPKTEAQIREILERGITAERDKDFLREKGWMLKSETAREKK